MILRTYYTDWDGRPASFDSEVPDGAIQRHTEETARVIRDSGLINSFVGGIFALSVPASRVLKIVRLP